MNTDKMCTHEGEQNLIRALFEMDFYTSREIQLVSSGLCSQSVDMWIQILYLNSARERKKQSQKEGSERNRLITIKMIIIKKRESRAMKQSVWCLKF